MRSHNMTHSVFQQDNSVVVEAHILNLRTSKFENPVILIIVGLKFLDYELNKI